MPPRGQVGRRIDSSLPPGRRALAEALVTLYQQLARPTTLKEVAVGLPADESTISRYLNGRRRPPQTFIDLLHNRASEDAGADRVAISLENLRKLHHEAERSRCPTCATLRRTIDTKDKQLRDLQAGLQAGIASASLSRPAPLPVPRQQGDRQRSALEAVAAQQLAALVIRLQTRGEATEVAELLRDAPGVLTPTESAAALALLHDREQHALADALVSIYGRDRSLDEVLRFASALHETGLAADAGALLRAAVG
ncbi:hypothetical protein ACQFX6_18805 [Streptomyces sp. DSM 41987]|uniref:hypothetical protein n=1 Tax=Streptomyces TaxID=1883 RepID=UPI0018DF7577|nr:hypothetical protein [Streptomyces fildesensis]